MSRLTYKRPGEVDIETRSDLALVVLVLVLLLGAAAAGVLSLDAVGGVGPAFVETEPGPRAIGLTGSRRRRRVGRSGRTWSFA